MDRCRTLEAERDRLKAHTHFHWWPPEPPPVLRSNYPDSVLVGDLLSIGAAIAFACYGIISRPLVKKYPAETVSAWSVLAGAIPLFVIALPGAMEQDWLALSGAAWLTIVYLAIFPVYIAYILWNFAIAHRGVARATTFSLLVPIVAGLLSALFLGEPFGPMKLLGAGLVLTGLVIVRTRGRRRPAARGATA